jgi:hypothetical protein
MAFVPPVLVRVFKADSGACYAYDGNTIAILRLDNLTSELIR